MADQTNIFKSTLYTDPITGQQKYGINPADVAAYEAQMAGTAETTTPQATAPTMTQTATPPAGSTYISDPAKLSSLTESDIWRDPFSDRIYQLPNTGLAGATPSAPDEINPVDGTDTTLSGTDNVFDYTRDVAESAMTEFEKAILQIQQDRLKVDEETRKREEEQRDAARLGLEEAYDQPTGLELYRQFEEEAGLKVKEEALNDIMSQISEIRQAATAEQNRLGASPYSTQFIMGRKRQITEKANADMASLVSAGEIIQNRIDAAERRITNYYNISIQDRQNEIDRRQMLYELEANDVIKLDEKEKEANDAAITMLQNLNERQRAEKDAVTSLMLQYPEAWAMAGGKLDLTAGYNEIASQLVPYINTVNQQAAAGSGTTKADISISADDRKMLIGLGFTNDDVNAIATNLNAGYGIDQIIDEMQFQNGPVPTPPYSQEQIAGLRSIFPKYEQPVKPDVMRIVNDFKAGGYQKEVPMEVIDENGDTIYKDGVPIIKDQLTLDIMAIPEEVRQEVINELRAQDLIE